MLFALLRREKLVFFTIFYNTHEFNRCSHGEFVTNTKFTAVILNFRDNDMLKVEIYVINGIMMSELVKNGNLFVKKRPKIKTLNFQVK